MTFVLHSASYLLAAMVGWIALLLAVATLLHGRAWVWARAREAWRGGARRPGFRRSRLRQGFGPAAQEPVFPARETWFR